MVPGFEDSGLIEFAKNPENRRKGIVLALYGTGNAPSRRKGYDGLSLVSGVIKCHVPSITSMQLSFFVLFRAHSFIEFLRAAQTNGVEIVVSSQCLRGSVTLGAYETGVEMKTLGLIDASDMTLEACVTKLAYLMGKGMRGAELKTMFEANLRGELSSRSSKQAFNASSVSSKL